jgi:hypothetical protein
MLHLAPPPESFFQPLQGRASIKWVEQRVRRLGINLALQSQQCAAQINILTFMLGQRPATSKLRSL